MFKKVFGDSKDKMPLRKLLECVLGINPKEITILNSEIIGSSYYNKGTIVDLIVEIEDGTKIGIEMNTNVNRSLINRNLYYMFKMIGQDRKRGSMYKELKKHIQINFDCEGYHKEPIMRYKLMEEKTKDILTDKIEIIRIDVPYFVNKCYNEDVNELDYKDRFIGLIGIEDMSFAKTIINGDKSMEDIMKKVDDFSVNEEILGAYDAEEHRKFVEWSIREQYKEEAQEAAKKAQEAAKEAQEAAKEALEEAKEASKEALKQGIEQGILNIAKNMKKEQLDINIISKVTGLSKEQIEDL